MQTNYSAEMAVGVPGMLADISENFVQSKVSETIIPFGLAVALGASDDTCKIPALGTDKILGVALFTHADNIGNGGYEAKKAVSVGRKCVAWVVVEDAVSAEGSVFVRYNGTGTKGAFRGAAVAGETLAINAKFLTSASAGGLAQVMFDL